MSVADRSDRLVGDALARLEREHGGFEVVAKDWALAPDWYERTRRRTEAGALGGAGIWLVGPDGRVLLVRREGEDRWEEPGGKHEPGESLAATARRETREEAGVTARIVDVAQAHRLTITDAEEPSRPPLVNLYVVFRGEPADGEPRPREGEIAAVRWWDAHPPELHYEELRSVPVPAAE